MNSILLFLIQVTVIFSVLYLLYILLLEKLTFHKLNRFVLLLLLPISISIPLSKHMVPSIASKIIEIPLLEHMNIEVITDKFQRIEEPFVASSFNYSYVFIAIYVLVFLLFCIRIISTARQLYALKNKSSIKQKDDDYQLISAHVPEIFSYFNWIFIPHDTFEDYNSQIIAHEKVHIKLKHSWDVIATEIYIAFFWFNPLLYFYRKSLKSVHEFQADHGVLENGVKTSQYLQLLLQSLEIPKPNTFYNYFNQPILEKRVQMLTKPTSNRFSKLKYMLFLPVCIFLISAFTSPIMEDHEYLKILEVPVLKSEPPSIFPVQNATEKSITFHFGVTAKHPITKTKRTHNGVDIRAKIGTPVVATADGIIAKASFEGNWGNLIVMTHNDGYETWYAHLKGFNSVQNQEVKKGDIIGYVGNTGLSTGPHLHYEVKLNGKHVNPLNYLK